MLKMKIAFTIIFALAVNLLIYSYLEKTWFKEIHFSSYAKNFFNPVEYIKSEKEKRFGSIRTRETKSASLIEAERKFAQKKAEMEKQKIKLTPLAFVMKAVVASLKAFPEVNASLDASGENLVMKK